MRLLLSTLALLIWCSPSFAQSHGPADDLVSKTISDTPSELSDEEVLTLLAENETIVVTGSRREQTLGDSVVATEVVTRREIKDSGAQNLGQLLGSQPGLEVVQGLRGQEVRMQGLSPDYVLILIDGQRTIGRVNGAINLSRMATGDIERIEIVKGPSSSLYGSDALAGVINIITRKGKDTLSTEVTTTIGGLGQFDAAARIEGRWKHWQSESALAWHEADGYDLDSTDLATTASGFEEFNASQRLRLGSDKRHFGLGAEYLLRDQQGIDESATGAVFDRYNRTEIIAVSVMSTIRVGTGQLDGSLRLSQWQDQFASDQRNADDLDTFGVSRERLVEGKLQFNHAIGSSHHVVAGIDTLGQVLSADRLSETGKRGQVALFLQDDVIIPGVADAIASPGVRVTYDSQFGSNISPKLAARWNPREDVALRASYGMGFRAPGFRELLLNFENPGVGYRVDGNPDLAPETSTGLNMSAQFTPTKSAGITLAGFHNEIENLITTNLVTVENGTQMFSYVNIGEARTMGVESQLSWKPSKTVQLELAYTFTDTLDRESNMPLPGRARHRGSFQASYQPFSELRLHARGTASGKRIYSSEELLESSSPFVDISARAETNITKFLTLYTGFNNLLGAGESRLAPMPPRTFYGGATITY